MCVYIYIYKYVLIFIILDYFSKLFLWSLTKIIFQPEDADDEHCAPIARKKNIKKYYIENLCEKKLKTK